MKLTASLLLLVASRALSAQQVADDNFNPVIATPAFASGKGPVVLLDEAHNNFHTVDGRYKPFVALLRRDGYVVHPNRVDFSVTALRDARVLVIANAINARNVGGQNWHVPTPSAFSDLEIDAVREWVRGGGSLLLIADHMPFGGAAEKLAAAFGASFSNGFATDSNGNTGAIRFRRADNSLRAHAIFNGRSAAERVDSLTTFTGQAFRIRNGDPLIVMGKGTLLLPDTAWQFSDKTKRENVEGMLQGAALEFGRGRVVLLAEAAMLSAQVSGPQRRPMGMNEPSAGQNPQFVLNVLHWLTRLY